MTLDDLVNAVYNNNATEVEDILKNNSGFDINDEIEDDDGVFTALNIAKTTGNSEIQGLLKSYGAAYNNSRILQSAIEGNLDKVKSYLKQGVNINTRKRSGLNSLECALSEGHCELALFLINTGIDTGQIQLLHEAVLGKCKDVVKYAINNNWDINEGYEENYSGQKEVIDGDLEGFTPLRIATKYGHKEIEDILVKHGAKT